jgi:hypothetical protein
MTMPNLLTALLDLLYALRDSDIKLIIGGGFGIYLRTNHVRSSGAITLLREWPEVRSTNDLDLFLRPELLIDSKKLKPLSDAFNKLGYEVVPGAAKFQFAKPGPEGSLVGGVKIDILTGPQSCFENTSVHTDDRRAQPRPSVGVHAHYVDEVPTLEKRLLSLPLRGRLSTDETWEAEVLLPHLFSFLTMKLFAFHDRFQDSDKEFGRYHALDIYTIVATATEAEWEEALGFRDEYRENLLVIGASELIAKYFSATDRMGIIRLKESTYFNANLQVAEFITVLGELFPIRS